MGINEELLGQYAASASKLFKGDASLTNYQTAYIFNKSVIKD